MKLFFDITYLELISLDYFFLSGESRIRSKQHAADASLTRVKTDNTLKLKRKVKEKHLETQSKPLNVITGNVNIWLMQTNWPRSLLGM